MSTVENGMMAARKTILTRLMIWLGFKFSAFAGNSGNDSLYIIHVTRTHWGFMDRLRILISGVTEVELCVEIEPEPITFLDGAAQTLRLNVLKTRSDSVVIAPGVWPR
jgi:hypothetical protein